MSSKFELDLAALHIDTNISHTIALANVTTSPKALEKLLDKHCSCTLREIILDSQSGTLDITKCSTETQLKFVTQLASERFDWPCFTNANDKIYVKCFLSTDPGICILKSNVTSEEANSSFKDKTREIPVNSKLHLACLVTDPPYVQNLMKQTSGSDVDTKDLLFYGVSCKEIVDIILQVDKAGVNAKDTRGRTPLFYALTRSLDSARKLLQKGARVTITDNRNVTVLTYFAENILDRLPVSMDEGLELLSSNGMQREKMIKEVVNLIFCKFIQVLGLMCVTSNSPDGLKPRMLCEPLKWVLGQSESDDKRNALVNQLQSMQEKIPADNETILDVVRPVFDILSRLGAKPSEARDSEGNTCLHYAARLIFHGVPRETVTYICVQLMEIDANMKLNAKNHREETPLLFCLSSTDLIASSETNNWSGSLQDVCRLLIDSGSELRYTTIKEESVFQLILKLSQCAILLSDNIQRQCIIEEMFQILEIFSSEENQRSITVNKRDVHLNSPLHLWASLALTSSNEYGKNVFDDYSFERLLKRILDLLLKCGVQLDDKNERGETPLHVCRTWTAVKLLLDAEANPSVTDSSGRTPLLAAAMNNTCLKKGSVHFYPDVTTEDTRMFWNDALDKKLDPWTADKNGESVLSTLIDKEANDLSTALIERACNQKMQIDTIGIPLLVTVCKDKSSEKGWKLDLVKKLLDTKRSLVHGTLSSSKDTALHFCCRNILELPEINVESSVQWEIIQYLLLCGADVTTAGESGVSCLDLSNHCSLLSNLLSTPVDYSQLPILLNNWNESSVEHKPQLSLVARMVKCQQVECERDSSSLHFSNEPLDTDRGSFGLVFVGIIHNGREVAVKRIVKANLPNGGVKSVLVPVKQCEQIVRYIFCKEDQHFYYVTFDLMEGNLKNYLDRTRASPSGCEDTTKLCKDMLLGLKILQSQGVVHSNINPRTVFYQIQGSGVCLKIGNCVVKSPRRGWTPSEVLNHRSAALVFSHQSDIFSCGLVLHYLLSDKKHPFAPVNCTAKTPEEIIQETETNILNGHIVSLDDSLSPEATHLVQLMLDSNPSSRPSAAEALTHPFFWDMERKKRFLHVVANEPEIAVQQKRYPLTAFEYELEEKFSTIVTRGSEWNNSLQYDKISATEAGMRVTPRNYSTVAGLVRFIRNAYEHINEQPPHIQTMWDTDFVLNDYFPNLLIEVYKALTTSKLHQLHRSREVINRFFSEL